MGFFISRKEAVKKTPHQNFAKCNCDGCPKQDTCQYGHIITDWLDGSKLSLADKYMLIDGNLVDSKEPKEPSGIANLEQRRDPKKLRKLSKECLQATLEYLTQLRQYYYDYGKCGIAYYRFMNIAGELQLVKQALKEYVSYHENLKKLSLVHPYILETLETHDFVLQRDVYKKFYMIEKVKVSKVIARMVEKELIDKVKYSSTYKLIKHESTT